MNVWRGPAAALVALTLFAWTIDTTEVHAASMAQAQQAAATAASASSNRMVSGALENAANSVAEAQAALGANPPDSDAAAEALSDAMTWLISAAQDGADVADLAEQIGAHAVEQGAMSQDGLDNLNELLAILREAQALQASTETGSLDQAMAIREIIIALHEIVGSGWHDFWYSLKGLRWYVGAAGSGTYLPGIIGRLLDYWQRQGDLSPTGRAAIEEMIRKFAEDAKAGKISGSEFRDRYNEIRDAISAETRAAGQRRKEEARRENERLEEEERRAAQTPSPQTPPNGPSEFPEATTISNPGSVAPPSAPGPLPTPPTPTAPSPPPSPPTPIGPPGTTPPTPKPPVPTPIPPVPTPPTPAPTPPTPPPPPPPPMPTPGPIGPEPGLPSGPSPGPPPGPIF